MKLRVKANKNQFFDFSNISNDKHFMVQFNKIANQLINDNQVNLINSINKFIINIPQTKIGNNQINYNLQQMKHNQQQVQSFIEQQIQLSRKDVFILLLMMYSNAIDKDNQNLKQTGFYQINMELIKQHQSNQSQEKLKCIHSYFINFFNRFIKQDEFNDQNQLKRQIGIIQQQIQEEEQKHYQKIQQLNQRIQMIQDQLLQNNKPIEQNEYDELVTFIRRTEFRKCSEIYNDQQCLISQFKTNKGRCEDCINSVLVNFADKNVGGLSLDPLNIAQEEVLMLTHPEALISMLFMEPMDDNEAILIKNVIKFNDYIGYGSTFRQKDDPSFINKNIIKNHILCMDALYYQNWQLQFEQPYIDRELIKSYVGFSLALDYTNTIEISTGKWGCGIFNGDVELKFFIQLLAFSKAQKDWQYKNEQNNNIQGHKNRTDRNLIFSSFNDNQFNHLISMYESAFNKTQISFNIIIDCIENLKQQIKQQRIQDFKR